MPQQTARYKLIFPVPTHLKFCYMQIHCFIVAPSEISCTHMAELRLYASIQIIILWTIIRP